MDVFEKMVLEDQDTDKKFIDATSFFVGLKEPIVKEAAKLTDVKVTPLPPQRTLKTTKYLKDDPKVRERALDDSRRVQEKGGGRPLALTRNKGGAVKPAKTDPTSQPRLRRLPGAKAAKIKKLKKLKAVTAKTVTASVLEKRSKVRLNFMDQVLLGKEKITKPSLSTKGMLGGMTPPTKEVPGFFQTHVGDPLSSKFQKVVDRMPFIGKGKAFGPESRRLAEINKARQARGLSKMEKLDEAEKWFSGFQKTKGLGDMLGSFRQYFANPDNKVTLTSALGGLGSMGLGPKQALELSTAATNQGANLMKQRQGILANNKLLIPAALATAGGAGLLTYKAMKEPEKPKLPPGYMGQ